MFKLTIIAIGAALLGSAQSQTASQANTPAEMVVTVGHYYTPEAPLLKKSDVIIAQGYDVVPVTSLIPLREVHAGLELYILVDNCSNCEPGSKVDEIRQFIVSQPASTAIGVAYIQNGQIHVSQKPSFDHEVVFGSLSAPSGSVPASPYPALTTLIANWKPGPPRRAVLMITTGIDPGATEGTVNPSVEATIQTAQHAGVIVYAIYHPSADYGSADVSKLYSAQVQLAHMASETGGEAYFTNFGPLPTLGPLLVDISNHLKNQYLVKFAPKPSAKQYGSLEQITVKCKNPSVMLIAPDRVWIPGPRPETSE